MPASQAFQKPQIVGINTLFLIPNKVGGTEYYTRSFLQELHDLEDQKNLDFVVFCNRENFATFQFTKKNWRTVLCPVFAENRLARIVFEYLILPLQVWQYGCTVFHSFGYTTPKVWFAKNIVTLHDANWKDHPQDSGWFSHIFLSALMRLTLAFADVVITDSEFSRERLLNHFPSLTHSFQVIAPGLDRQFFKLLEKKQKLPASVPAKFIFCVSAFYPHKRVEYALDIWERLSLLHPEYSFVLVGQNGSEQKKIEARIANLPRVKHFMKVSYPELVSLYQHAELFVFPSVYEGFGFPIYEALTAGLPSFVGKKECYEKQVQDRVQELSFQVDSDVMAISEVLKSISRNKKNFDHNFRARYEQSAKKLQELYLA
jgi:glycosyltransferase involved in cell wall biosynthesis